MKSYLEILEEKQKIMDATSDYDDEEDDFNDNDDDMENENYVEVDDDDEEVYVAPPKMTKQEIIDKLKRLSQIKQTIKKIVKRDTIWAAPINAAPVMEPTIVPQDTSQNNDNRLTCYACGAPTKEIDGLFKKYRICSACGK